MLTRIIGLMAIIMAVCGGIFYWYYNDSQQKIADLNKQLSAIQAAETICKSTVSQMEEQRDQLTNSLTQINGEFAVIRAQNSILAKKLEKHDIGVLGAAKPGLVEKIITNATDRANRCTELLSGAPFTEKELAATSAKNFNSECPWLWPGGTQ